MVGPCIPTYCRPDSIADDAHAARRRYKKDLDLVKPDLAAYNKQKEIAMGLAPGTLTAFNASSQVCFLPCLVDGYQLPAP